MFSPLQNSPNSSLTSKLNWYLIISITCCLSNTPPSMSANIMPLRSEYVAIAEADSYLLSGEVSMQTTNRYDLVESRFHKFGYPY